jgi:hypothetical protein
VKPLLSKSTFITSVFSKTFICFRILLLYFSNSLFAYVICSKSCLWTTSISIRFVRMFVLTNLCIHLIHFFVSFFFAHPLSLPILHRTIFSLCLDSLLNDTKCFILFCNSFTNDSKRLLTCGQMDMVNNSCISSRSNLSSSRSSSLTSFIWFL